MTKTETAKELISCPVWKGTNNVEKLVNHFSKQELQELKDAYEDIYTYQNDRLEK